MFSGIIETIHTVNKIDSSRNPVKLYINYSKKNISLGDSVSINGVCLTVSSIQDDILMFELSSETIEKTNLSLLHPDSHINLELPLTLNKFISGHLVSGHIDSTVKVKSLQSNGKCWNMALEMTDSIKSFIVKKGSITVDGVSLTINSINNDSFDLMIIPHTFENTIIKYYKEGHSVNIELDYIAKYIVKHMDNHNEY